MQIEGAKVQNGKRELSSLQHMQISCSLYIPTPASQDPQGFSIPLADANCMNWLTACSLLFVLYGSSSVPALLFLAATTRLYHNPLAKLN